MTITDDDLPPLFKISDKISGRAQKQHLLISFGLLFFAFLASSASAYIGDNIKLKSILGWSSCTIFILSFLLTTFSSQFKAEWTWYNGRAIAESVKTLSWRFMMHSDPYAYGASTDNSVSLFGTEIRRLASANPDFNMIIQRSDPLSRTVTNRMIEIRNLNFENRKEIYLRDRIENQRRWYVNKSAFNTTRGKLWNWSLLLLHGLGILFSVVGALNPQIIINILGLVATIISICVAWLQIKRYQDLANSYSIAANDLASVKDEGMGMNEQEFPQFVSNAENAISREHTLWIAKRDPV